MRFEIVMIETTKAVYEVEADNIEDARDSYWEFPCTRSVVGDDHEIEYSIIEEKEPTVAEGFLEDWLKEHRKREQDQ